MAKTKKKANPQKSWRRLPCETTWQYLKRIIKVNWLQLIVAILALCVAIYPILPPSEDVRLSNEITSQIQHIEAAFKPEIFANVDTIYVEEINVIREFQIKALEFCSIYSSIKTSSIKSLNNDNKDYTNHLLQYIEKFDRLNKLDGAIDNCISKLAEYAIDHHIEDYALIDLTKQNEINALRQKYEIELGKVEKKVTINVQERKVNKVIDNLESLRTNKSLLKYVNKELTYIIDVKNIISIRVNNMKLENQ